MNRETEAADGKRKTDAHTGGLAGNLGKAVSNTAAKTKDIAAKTQESIMSVLDKNGDGKIGAEDFGLGAQQRQEASLKVKKLASAAGQSLKKSGDAIGKAVAEAKNEMDRRMLRPVFSRELLKNATDVNTLDEISGPRLPSMICIVERDKRRRESDVCSGAAGYLVTIKGTEMLNLYEDSAASLGITFYPTISKTIYYADTYCENLYINLDEYFNYLKNARVNELEMVAQALGARRVQITFKEKKKVFVSKNARMEGKAEKSAGSASYDKSDNEYSRVEIASDVRFSGHDTPTIPPLVYFRSESDIGKLIQMRTGDNANKIESKIYRFQCDKSSGIKETEAAKIDAVLGQLKCSGTASISSEAQRESRTDLEYIIEF